VTDTSVTDPAAPASGLRRQLGLRHLVANGLVFIGPAAPVGIFGTLLARSHGAVVTVYLIATAVMTLTAVAYAQLSAVVPRAGSVYSYASAAIGPRAGFFAGWMVLLDYLLIPSVAFLFTGLAMHSFVPDVPAWVFSGAAVVVAVDTEAGMEADAEAGVAADMGVPCSFSWWPPWRPARWVRGTL